MVRCYRRKTVRGIANTPELLDQASKLMRENNVSLREAAKSVGIDKSALSRYLKGRSIGYDNKQRILSKDCEQLLAEYLLTCSRMHHGLTPKEARKLAFSYAKAKALPIPVSWEDNQEAGIDWMQAFLKRHSFLSVRKPEATSLARSTAFNRHTVSEFQMNLQDTRRRYEFPPSRIYNMDETALTTVHVPPKVIAAKNTKQVGQITSAERGLLVTTVCCISASGNSIPPTFIWPRKTERYLKQYMNGTPTGSLGLCHESGWMESNNFINWMRHFIENSSASKESRVLLLLDNHLSHVSIEAINLAKENGVEMLTFPPHVTHKLQPLDVSVYGPLKKHYNSLCNSWLLDNPSKAITLYEVGQMAGKAIPRAVTPENIISGYRKTGIFPFDRDVFSDADFLPSAISDRPAPSELEEQPLVTTTPTTSVAPATTGPDGDLPTTGYIQVIMCEL